MLHNLRVLFALLIDILVYGRMKEEHDRLLRAVLHRVRAAGLNPSKEKCEFG